MTQTIRVSLPSYNALTDTNLDHYALYADQDNVLIKEFARGSISVAGDGELHSLTHNLGYVPFFLCYVYDAYSSPNGWTTVPHFQGALSAPPYAAAADTTKLWFFNQIGTTDFKYFIFYDRGLVSGTPSFTPSDYAIAASKAGVNVLSSTNPNDFIFHSDLNTFKIIKEATFSFSYNGTPGSTYDITHNAGISNSSSFTVFLKFPDGYTTIVQGNPGNASRDLAYVAFVTRITTSVITISVTGSGGAATIYGKFYIFETPIA